MKKAGIFILVFALSLFVLTGCSGDKNPSTQPSAPAGTPGVTEESRSMSETLPSQGHSAPAESWASEENTDNLGDDIVDGASKAMNDASRALDDVVTGTDSTKGR